MKIDELSLKNFRGFEDRTFRFHPEFNLIVGENATGKTGLLEALAIAAGTWFIGFRNRLDKRNIGVGDIRLDSLVLRETTDNPMQFPVVVTATGSVAGQSAVWKRTKESEGGKTRYGEAVELRTIARDYDERIRQGEPLNLPVIAYYGTMRLWQEPRDLQKNSRIDFKAGQLRKKTSRLDGYKHSVDPRISVNDLVSWFARQEWISFQEGKATEFVGIVKKAVCTAINAQQLFFNAKRGELLVEFEKTGLLPFANLSDGQRSMLAMVADLAQKVVTLNPHLGKRALEKTAGVVLIDELDLHLHPRWQVTLIERLRKAFPAVQFICTTHSPFLIQSLRSGEELLSLDEREQPSQLNNKGIETIAATVMGVETPEASPRYMAMLEAAKEYLGDLSSYQDEKKNGDLPEERLKAYKKQLANRIAGFADNPAYQAILESERIVNLGE